MKTVADIIKTAVAEIEEPLRAAGFLEELAARAAGAQEASVVPAAFELAAIRAKSARTVGAYESIESFIRASDFMLARNLMAFGLVGAAAFFTMRFCSPENMIFALYGATAFYIFTILLTPQKLKRYKLMRAAAIREYRENLIDFCRKLIKKHSLAPEAFPIALKGEHIFDGLTGRDGAYYFKAF